MLGRQQLQNEDEFNFTANEKRSEREATRGTDLKRRGPIIYSVGTDYVHTRRHSASVQKHTLTGFRAVDVSEQQDFQDTIFPTAMLEQLLY